MKPSDRLLAIAGTLDDLGLRFLVMGGHAARFYGIDRNTLDYDMHLASEPFARLKDTLKKASLFQDTTLVEGPSWRPDSFKRFIIGRLASGQEERLEFWKENHLLPPFEEAYERRETYDDHGRRVSFLSLRDLIRSKETERESDWQDVALLEEVLDSRHLTETRDESDLIEALSQLRSQKGFERATAKGILKESRVAAEAALQATSPITLAYLIPFVPRDVKTRTYPGPVGEVLQGPLRNAPPGSLRHKALVEVIRRHYKQAAIAADRADKAKAAEGPAKKP